MKLYLNGLFVRNQVFNKLWEITVPDQTMTNK